jgi:hypothetical protein
MTALLLLVSYFTAQQAAPPRDPAAAQRGAAATVRGRVVAADTGEPLHRVRVALSSTSPNAPFSVTDTRGEFEIAGVAAGSYAVTFTRAGYLSIQYGQRAPREPGRTLAVKAGETIDGINVALPRGGVLAGRSLTTPAMCMPEFGSRRWSSVTCEGAGLPCRRQRARPTISASTGLPG